MKAKARSASKALGKSKAGSTPSQSRWVVRMRKSPAAKGKGSKAVREITMAGGLKEADAGRGAVLKAGPGWQIVSVTRQDS